MGGATDLRRASRTASRALVDGRRAGGVIVLVAASLATSGACVTRGINSDRLLAAFNTGATDSFPDPTLSRFDIGKERVRLTARGAFLRGFTTQGLSRRGLSVARWLASPVVQQKAWDQVKLRRADRGQQATTGTRNRLARAVVESATDACAQRFEGDFIGFVTDAAPPDLRIVPGPVCGADKKVTDAGHLYADAARLAAAIDIVAIEVARMLDEERVVDETAAEAGVRAAMMEASEYLGARRWTPSDRAPTLGLSIKGGASTGVYSAGVVWRVLTLMQRYREWKASRGETGTGIAPEEARLAVTSGTSAGAIIAAVADIFHDEHCQVECAVDPSPNRCAKPACKALAMCGGTIALAKGQRGPEVEEDGPVCREYARRLTASLFTCPSQSQLYCVDSRPIWTLAGPQLGLMDFDGLRTLIERYVKADALTNQTELVLTTVDFRWGQLYVESDQDPSTVFSTRNPPWTHALADLHRDISASFVLPFIAWPVKTLRLAGEDRPGLYVDGGIQSEIPINALVQRGVEHALVVGSAPPESTPVAPPTTGLGIALHYLDVSLSGVTVAEWRDAMPRARYVEAFESASCDEMLKRVVAPGAMSADAQKAFCEGRLSEACGGIAFDAMARVDQMDLPPATKREVLAHEPGRAFDIVGIFRDEATAPTYGYSFDPIQMHRLFATGAADARGRCAEIAVFLGMGDAGAELDTWCNESPKFDDALCEASSEEYRTCSYKPEDLPP